MSFNSVIGQDQVKRRLVEMVRLNRLSHALLFLGQEGSGALPMALAFAQYIVCEKADGNQDDACGICPSCVKASRLIHPDIHYSYPVIPKKPGDKPVSTDYSQEWREFIRQYPYGNAYDWLQFIGAENKQGNITAQECNDIIHKLSLKSFESGYKILVMWMPEYLGNEGNKLLKLIEEPPPDTLFALVAENESLILPTILSRTQLVKLPLPQPADIEKALIERAAVEPGQARQIAVVCEGNYHEALQLIRHADDDWQGVLRDWLNAILKTGPVAQVKWIDEISRSGRERQKQFLRYFNHLLEQAIRLRCFGDNSLPIPEAERDVAQRLNKIADIGQQKAIIEELDRAAYYIERNAHAKMLFHALTIKLYHILAEHKLARVN
ncbi:MAG TPA: DNA polymerase III subunit [Puia sp.]|nr:DNA polymerase III subunit [Puia sp.]